MKVQLEVGKRPQGDVPMVVATYRDPKIILAEEEKSRIETRLDRLSRHKPSLYSLMLHSMMVGVNVVWAVDRIAHPILAILTLLVGAGSNVFFAWWAWRKAMKTFS